MRLCNEAITGTLCIRYELVGRSADMWGLGVLMYEVYNGELRLISEIHPRYVYSLQPIAIDNALYCDCCLSPTT